MRKNKNNKFTYAFGAAAAAVVYMVAPLPEAGAAIFAREYHHAVEVRLNIKARC